MSSLLISLLDWIWIVLLAGQILLACLVTYLLLLTVSAWRFAFRPHSKPGDIGAELPLIRFLILIPAHNEERILPNLLNSLAKMRYPRSLFEVHVVADNCQDGTAEIAERNGAQAHVRNNQTQKGKGYALQWLLEQIWQESIPHDAVVILDADSTVSENFLSSIAEHVEAGETAIQSYYAVQNPEASWSTSLRYAALSVLHYLRPSGRMVLGGSVGLKGNGMVFSAQVARQYPWPASITEDIEYHTRLVLDGKRVTFAPQAVVWGEMPVTLAAARSQHTRWEGGRLEMGRRYIPQLVREALNAARRGFFKQVFILFDAAMEHLLPPFSLLAALSGVGLLANLALLFLANDLKITQNDLFPSSLILSMYLLIGQAFYLVSGLLFVKAPAVIYRRLIFAPFLIIWKVWHYLSVLVNRSSQEWVRTARNEG